MTAGLSNADQQALRIAIDRDETGPGDYNDTSHVFAAVAALVARERTAARNEALDEAAHGLHLADRLIRALKST